MAKLRTTFFCQNCGHQEPKWVGRCNQCSEWNTFVEEVVAVASTKAGGYIVGEKSLPKPLLQVEDTDIERHHTPDIELNRVLGGGIVPGSLVLIGGEPGIGKSTLLLQLAMQLKTKKVLYISGEESETQIKMRAERLGAITENCYIYCETSTIPIFEALKTLKPHLVIVDSIQTISNPSIESSPGSVSQVRQCANDFMRFAKEKNISVFLIGHITKEGSIAGPKVLEHLVDTVIQFEGDGNYNYRIIRATKNRFGSIAELGIYEMLSTGLRQVTNPSEMLLTQRADVSSGIAIAAIIEGNRPLFVEVQALVSATAFGMPQRSTTGYDPKRLNMLVAVLEKRAGFKLGNRDIFLNIAGGIKTQDPGIDLAVAVSIISSLTDKALPYMHAFAGEIGLGGEIRVAQRLEMRLAEAEKLGFERMYHSSLFQNKTLALKQSFSHHAADINRLLKEIF